MSDVKLLDGGEIIILADEAKDALVHNIDCDGVRWDGARVGPCSECCDFDRAAGIIDQLAATAKQGVDETWKAHVPCTNEQHDPANGLIAGFCVRCRHPWPCEFSPENATARAGLEDRERLDWLERTLIEGDTDTYGLYDQAAGCWFVGEPPIRVESLRAAIDAARSEGR